MYISEDEWHRHLDVYHGFCTHCQAWTADNVESDARKYVCPECQNSTVLGAEEALISGAIIIMNPILTAD